MLLGAGTVVTVDQVKTAVDCGAQYIVSPGLSRTVIEYCRQNDIAVTPGVATPTEIEAALDLGLQVVKFFPAEANGGLEYLKAISAPFKQMKFIPTGGIDENNLLPYLKFPAVLACGGSWMVKADLVSGKRFDEVKRLTEQAVAKMLGFQLSHMGINNPNPTEAAKGASLLSRLLQLPIKDGDSSMFVGTQFELLKRQYLGRHGHVAIGTNFIERAIAYVARKGVGVKEETKIEKSGKLATVYLDTEVGGFAIHLLQM
jgi:2-dehydro-3-deoxyphosphogluconate aldolase/(4S)-4-hydroxy-2-oxoglutarate aldolase